MDRSTHGRPRQRFSCAAGDGERYWLECTPRGSYTNTLLRRVLPCQPNPPLNLLECTALWGHTFWSRAHFPPQKGAKIPQKNPAIMTVFFWVVFVPTVFPPSPAYFSSNPVLKKRSIMYPRSNICPKIGLFSPEIGPYPSETIRNIGFFGVRTRKKWWITLSEIPYFL